MFNNAVFFTKFIQQRLVALIVCLDVGAPGGGFSLDGKIKASNFIQKKIAKYSTPNLTARPSVNLPKVERVAPSKATEERLSQIIEEINLRAGKNFDRNEGVLQLLSVAECLKKSKDLEASARNNSRQDFELAFFRAAGDALVQGLERYQEFFNLLLSNDDLKRQALGPLASDVYKSFRNRLAG